MPNETEFPPCISQHNCETAARIYNELQEAEIPDNLLFLKERCLGMKALLESMGDPVTASDCPQVLFKKYLPEAAFTQEA
ncbi:MAG: hypothetical protein JWO54_904 [Candidatus Saccharibacteria bacterium]|nr:hypothetical protein [Candidatus Saccharibacteria bacterium]MDB5181141.1 hypothetical protein [Candidatus Saccharibacteria bacterium]